MAESDYWRKRQEKKYLQGENTTKEFYKGLEKSFIQAKRDIQSIINDFYVRYSIENDINNMTKAKRSLSKVEIGDLEAFIDKARENMGKYNLELNNMSIRARITRYEALQKQIDCILQQLYAIDYEVKGKEVITEVYKESYYQSWFNFDQYFGFHAEYAQIDPRRITELIAYPFDGADFSTRLWRQKDYLVQQLKDKLTTALIQGKNPQALAKDFAKTFSAREFEAWRLLHTEASFMIEQATHAAYVEEDIDKYQWDATLDIKTCSKCGDLDGKTFLVREAVVGVNAPPAHSLCRCTDIPYFDDEDIGDQIRMARDPVTGKTYNVPADMTYQGWYDKYVMSDPEALLAEKKHKNKAADEKQYQNYKDALGKFATSSLDDFQNLKYNDNEKFGLVKLDYARRKNLIDNPELALPNADSVILPDEKFTKYLFSETNLKGKPKGDAFNSRLGYNISNWTELQNEIQGKANKYPAVFKDKIQYGDIYEQKMILYGKKDTPANVIVGWINKPDGTISMTTAYIKEVN